MSVRNVFCVVVIRVAVWLRDFDSAVEPSGTEEGHRGWIRNCGPVDFETVVMKTNHKRSRGDGPDAIRTLGHIEPGPDSYPDFMASGAITRNMARWSG